MVSCHARTPGSLIPMRECTCPLTRLARPVHPCSTCHRLRPERLQGRRRLVRMQPQQCAGGRRHQLLPPQRGGDQRRLRVQGRLHLGGPRLRCVAAALPSISANCLRMSRMSACLGGSTVLHAGHSAPRPPLALHSVGMHGRQLHYVRRWLRHHVRLVQGKLHAEQRPVHTRRVRGAWLHRDAPVHSVRTDAAAVCDQPPVRIAACHLVALAHPRRLHGGQLRRKRGRGHPGSVLCSVLGRLGQVRQLVQRLFHKPQHASGSEQALGLLQDICCCALVFIPGVRGPECVAVVVAPPACPTV